MVGLYGPVEMAQAAVRQRPLEPGRADLDRKYALLPRLGRPAAAVHHPQERRLDPRNPVPLEWSDEPAGRYRRLGNLRCVRLVHRDRLSRVPGPDLTRGNGHQAIIAYWCCPAPPYSAP